MHGFTRRKKQFAAMCVIALFAMAGVALAFWTGSGGGTGTTTIASGDTVTLHAILTNGIAPGLTRTVSFTADNGNTSPIQVTTVHLDSVTTDAGHADCVVAPLGDFAMPDVVVNQDVPVTTTTPFALTATGLLSFANTSSNQDACKGATLTLHVSTPLAP